MRACTKALWYNFPMLLHYAFNDSTDGVYLHIRSDGSLFNIARLKGKTLVCRVLVKELIFADDFVLVSHKGVCIVCLASLQMPAKSLDSQSI